MARDDFSTSTKDVLAKRVNLFCSNPGCGKPTAGPHSDPARAVNVGVAAHITAAAPGGPRFDKDATPEIRSSCRNGIWLCQTCAKLVDNDPSSYTVAVLLSWRGKAEARAMLALHGRTLDELPQPSSAKHTPLPRIRWLPYDIARLQLVEFGWHPILRHPNTRDDPDIRYGNGPHYWEKGFQEIVCASPTGTAACTFAFKDAYGHVLEVATEGEAEADIDSEAIVMSWRIQDALTSSAPSTTTPVPERHAIKVNRRLTPTNILDSIEVGTPPEKVRERLGIPDLVLVDTWQYRFVDTQVEILFETGHVHSVVIALVQNYKYHGQDATFGDFVLGNMTIGDVSDMGHKHIEYRDSMRTKEVIVPMRVGPTGAWSECFFGALVVFSGAGVLAETEFDWAHTEGRLCSPAQSTVFNWVGIGGSGGEPPYFSWFIKP